MQKKKIINCFLKGKRRLPRSAHPLTGRHFNIVREQNFVIVFSVSVISRKPPEQFLLERVVAIRIFDAGRIFDARFGPDSRPSEMRRVKARRLADDRVVLALVFLENGVLLGLGRNLFSDFRSDDQVRRVRVRSSEKRFESPHSFVVGSVLLLLLRRKHRVRSKFAVGIGLVE